jgi:predicted acyl esterase
MYVLASFSSGIHTEGSLRGFLFSSSKEKWYAQSLYFDFITGLKITQCYENPADKFLAGIYRLRIHHTQEWHDLYQPANNEDLQKFFDKYLLGHDNGWEKTPKVRHSLLGYNCAPVINRPDIAYPPPSVAHTTLFLSCSTSSLQLLHPPRETSSVNYRSDSWDDDGAHFTYKFSTYTELIGYSKVSLYMSCADADDMDVYVIIRKLDAQGRPLLNINIPLEDLPPGTKETDIPDLNIFKYVGPNGRLRASHRQVMPRDPELSAEQSQVLYPAEIWHPHDDEVKICPGDIVCLEIPLWPSGIIFQAGESMRLEVKGHEVTLPEFPALDRVPTNLNRGRHVVYCGKEYPSSIVLPLVEGMTP